MTQRKILMVTSSVAWLAVAGAVQAQEASRVDDVVVTGSRLAGGERIATVETVARETVAAAGIADASQLVRLVTANSGSEAQVDQLNQPQSSGTAQFNLRNLGLGSTLVLLNGRRLPPSGVGAGLIIGWLALLVLTFHWSRVVWARSTYHLALEEERRREAVAREEAARKLQQRPGEH